jgi:MYXO-CTERM domain-containing protein
VNVHVSPRGCYCRAPGGAAVAPQLLPLSLLPIALFFWRRKRRANG